jgi:Major Facilitator Superfamily
MGAVEPGYRTAAPAPPGYIRLVVAATLARTGNEMAPVAITLHVLEETGSGILAGATVAGFTLAGLITGPLLGIVLDRARRQGLVFALEPIVSGAGLALLAAAAGSVPNAFVPLLGLLAGALVPLSAGGSTSVIPDLVRPVMLPRANTFEAASFNVATVIGPLAAGVVAGTSGTFAAMLVLVAVKLAALPLFAGIPERKRGRRHGPLRPVLAAAVRVVADSAPLRAVTVAGAIALAGRGLLVVAFPVFALEHLGAGEAFAGFLWAAFAVGSIVGLALFIRLQTRSQPEGLTLVATGAAGAAMLLWPLPDIPVLALVAVGVAGALYGPGLAATFAVRQREVPAELRGQVFTTAASLKTGCFALGAAASGPTVVAWGPAAALIAAAGAQLAAALVGAALLRQPRAAATS